MPKPRIYVDTTIPSAYHTRRTDPGSVERRATTRRWWQSAVRTSELLISDAVLQELSDGISDQVVLRLSLVEGLEVLPATDDIARTEAVYMQQKLMPQDPEGDALHLALASHHRCDALVTWNYHHLANPNKLDRIRRLNEELGLFVPRICTPKALLEGHHE
ncbi:MAG TPA: type II toxin-antitoxin system VapC family toxin [Longimicrobium sp.]